MRVINLEKLGTNGDGYRAAKTTGKHGAARTERCGSPIVASHLSRLFRPKIPSLKERRRPCISPIGSIPSGRDIEESDEQEAIQEGLF